MSGTLQWVELDNHERSAWLRQVVAQRAAEVEATYGGGVPASVPVMTWAAYAPGPPGGREDRTCDRCRSYVPESDTFCLYLAPAESSTGRRLLLTGGLCQRCGTAEVPDLLDMQQDGTEQTAERDHLAETAARCRERRRQQSNRRNRQRGRGRGRR